MNNKDRYNTPGRSPLLYRPQRNGPVSSDFPRNDGNTRRPGPPNRAAGKGLQRVSCGMYLEHVELTLKVMKVETSHSAWFS